jgi:hypothetical protein
VTVGHTAVYSTDPVMKTRISRAVQALCRSRQRVAGLRSPKVQLTPSIANVIIEKMVEAASHAAASAIPNATPQRGAPPDNARIILAHDVLQACEGAGLSPGLRYVHPPSFAAELFVTVASLVWPSPSYGYWNPRRTFERMRRAGIIRN